MLTLIGQIKWLFVLPHLLIFIAIMSLLGGVGMTWDIAAILAAMLYLGLSVVLQNVIPADHRRAMRLFRDEAYEEAKAAFNDSYNFFRSKAWLDDYRSIFILSVSKMSYQEIALVNMALCDFQQGNMIAARAAYERVLEQYPNSQMAKDAIAYIDNPEAEELGEEFYEEDTEDFSS